MATSRVVKQVNRQLEAQLATLGAANSPEMKAAARALAKGIRRALGPKSKEVSKPGEPPKGKSGELAKSVKEGQVGTGRRVAVTKFTASLLQFGVNTHQDGQTPRSRRDLFSGAVRQVFKQSEQAFTRRARQRSRNDPRRKAMVLEPRPFMEKGLENAAAEMTEVAVSAIRRRTSLAPTP